MYVINLLIPIFQSEYYIAELDSFMSAEQTNLQINVEQDFFF